MKKYILKTVKVINGFNDLFHIRQRNIQFNYIIPKKVVFSKK